MNLVSIPVVDISLLPISLPVADGINNGGFKVPNSINTSTHEYSPIDLLIAGIEALRRDIIVTSLASFFDNNRDGCSSESDVYITLKDIGGIYTWSISRLRQEIKFDDSLYKMMLRNAPLTFKWVDK
jgi:hypothetical protein